MRNKYNEQLRQLNEELIQMGDLCNAAITYAVSSLKNGDLESKERVVEIENEINQKERLIEQCCMKILLRQQPVASDLRQVSSALKMISDMERIGDQAFDISLMSPVDLEKGTKVEKHILRMAKNTISMVSKSVESFVMHDLEMAYSVIKEDDEIDEYFMKIKNDLIFAIQEDSESGSIYLDLLMIAKYLERIGDHATNIAEWVEYSITGKHAKLGEKGVD